MTINRSNKPLITLATLEKASEQQIFNYVGNHLLRQGHKSTELGNDGRITCKYRSEKGKCAAGVLLADDEYHAAFEGNSWKILVQTERVPQHHHKLISLLQDVHDLSEVCEWGPKLSAIAKHYRLSTRRLSDSNASQTPTQNP